jgi:beta-lactam-binding protein with PASTA domain
MTAAGLTLRTRKVPSAKPVGTVLAQNPPRDQKVSPRTVVTVNISGGTGLVVVPALLNLDQRKAVARLRAAGLRAVVVAVPSAKPKGVVVAQDPPREAKVKPGTRVRINVSKGP